MDKIAVMIIEDNEQEAQNLNELLKEDYAVVGVASTYKQALELYYQAKPDVVIIDVFLQGSPDGLTFAETISTVPGLSRPFVFLTSSTDRHIFEKAKVTNPFGFLLKPYNELEVQYAIEVAVEKFYRQQHVFASPNTDTVVSKDLLFIKKKNALHKVRISDILYVEVEERYCNVITEGAKFLIQISLAKILELLDANRFCQTHRNFVVNKEKVLEIMPADNLIILEGNHKITFSDKYKGLLSQFRILK